MQLGRKCNHYGNLEFEMNEYNISVENYEEMLRLSNPTASPLSPSKTEAYSEMDTCPWPHKHIYKHFIKLQQGFIL